MAIVRVVNAEAPQTLAVVLRRAGADPSHATTSGSVTALCTGVSAEAASAVAEAVTKRRVALLAGGAGGSREVLVLSGTRAGFAELCEELRKRGSAAVAFAADIDASLAADSSPPPPMHIGRRRFAFGERTYVMGVVNVTPDSFSDGGRFLETEAAVRQGVALAQAGADVIDVGGESTRPGAEAVGADAETERVLPVVRRLAQATEVPVSIDTTKASVAGAALAAGAVMVNDVSGFRGDPLMAGIVARYQAAACAMHMRGNPRTMQDDPRYFDVVGEVIEYLSGSLEIARRAGLDRQRVFVDPGIGFGKTLGHNLFLLRHVRQLRVLGSPILVGPSRKSFIGKLTGRPADERQAGTLTSVAAAVLAGADMVRVHDVAEVVDAVKVAQAIRDAHEGGLLFEAGSLSSRG